MTKTRARIVPQIVPRIVVLAGAVVAWPSVAHADAAGPSDWHSEIVSIEPANDAVSVSIEGGDAFVRIVVDEGHEAIVHGYDGEPYLHVDPAGDVYENRNSYATYFNTRRDGSGPIPADLDTSAEPDWVKISEGGAWAWHDHRAHWMGDSPPPDIEPGESLAPQVIPITVDGAEIRVTIRTTLVERPSWWVSIAGAALGLAVGAAALAAPARWRGMIMTAAALAALVAGVAQFASVPSETGPAITWWLMPAIAASAALGVTAIGNRAPFVRQALSLIAASQLVLWGVARRHGVRRGVLPTELPFTLDRLITITALLAGVALVVAVAIDLLAMLRQPPTASSMASSSAS